MNRNNNNRRRNKGKKSGMTREYAAPILRKISVPFIDITVSGSSNLFSGGTGINGVLNSVLFSGYSDMQRLSAVYQYFEITGHKIDYSAPTTTAFTDSFNGGAIAYRPLNYILGEATPSVVPTSIAQVMELPGAIFIQAGAMNKGRWFKPTSKQVYSSANAIGSGNIAGAIYLYIDDIGVSETAGDFTVYMNVRFYGRQFSATE